MTKAQAAAGAPVKLPPALMFQGTASNAGKSILTAGLCRLLARKGLKVAPFKAQNMSLNSWVADGGLELGVAQALQARACGLAPDARMNPVLLKPMGTAGCQVIVSGKPLGIMPYEEYVRIKPQIWRHIKDAYNSLAQDKNVIILEGAGSPAEINLREHDVVNMRMARHARAHVLLTADIDLGGAFAALTGTMSLLRPGDRKMVKAFVLNKFRGNAGLLEPALAALRRRWQKPFAGIVPMLPLHLPQEDSATSNLKEKPAQPGQLDLAVICLPAMSNLGDFDPLAAEAHCRLVRDPGQLGLPHAVIIPGSRHVPMALEHLRTTGMDTAIAKYAAQITTSGKGQIIGLCAGLQLLGEQLHDPDGVEGGGSFQCLGLLPLTTTLGKNKILSHTEAIALPPFCRGTLTCMGNEIHHGGISTSLAPVITSPDGRPLGWAKGHIWGTWLHGIFDSDQFRHAWLGLLAKQWGMTPPPQLPYDLDGELDKLASALEENMDMKLIYNLINDPAFQPDHNNSKCMFTGV